VSQLNYDLTPHQAEQDLTYTIAADLVKHSNQPHMQYKISVVDTTRKKLCMVCFPNRIIISRAVLLMCLDMKNISQWEMVGILDDFSINLAPYVCKDYLAALIAHELIHIMEKHFKNKNFIQQRLAEFECDNKGSNLLIKAGYAPCAFESIFRIALRFGATHPHVTFQERISKLKVRMLRKY
jgi:predicted Zn-dependent protease